MVTLKVVRVVEGEWGLWGRGVLLEMAFQLHNFVCLENDWERKIGGYFTAEKSLILRATSESKGSNPSLRK